MTRAPIRECDSCGRLDSPATAGRRWKPQPKTPGASWCGSLGDQGIKRSPEESHRVGDEGSYPSYVFFVYVQPNSVRRIRAYAPVSRESRRPRGGHAPRLQTVLPEHHQKPDGPR